MDAAVGCLQLRSECAGAKTSRSGRRQQLVAGVGARRTHGGDLRATTPRSVRPGQGQTDSIVSGLLALDAPRQLDPSQGTSHPARSHKSMAAANRLWRVAAA